MGECVEDIEIKNSQDQICLHKEYTSLSSVYVDLRIQRDHSSTRKDR